MESQNKQPTICWVSKIYKNLKWKFSKLLNENFKCLNQGKIFIFKFIRKKLIFMKNI